MTLHPTIRRQVRSLVAWLALAWISLLTSPPAARAEVTLQADFDQASLNIARSRVDGDVVTLVGRDNYNSGHWKWIYFAAKGVAGRQLTFRIDGDYVFGSGTLAEHRMTYSFDRKNWKFFDINQLSADGMFTFFNETPFREDVAYIAYGLPYPYQRVVEHAERIAASPWAGEQSHRFFEMGANWARALHATLAAPSNLSIGAADSPREKVSATPPK
jgi:hypothetical protein